MTCPLCRVRRARRGCPALGHSICSVCCGTKRVTEIRCPSDCAYLATAREHPPAATVRQQQQDSARLMRAMRDLGRDQSRLFLSVNAFISQYQAPDIQRLIDADVAEAAGALASTFETAARGLIYDHRPSSRPAERLVAALKPVLDDAARTGGTSFQRDAAIVLRRTEESARGHATGNAEEHRPDGGRSDGGQHDYLDLLSRVFRPRPSVGKQTAPEEGDARLIVL
jgi:hypothetical protein